MARHISPIADQPAFAQLPVSLLRGADGHQEIAYHLSGVIDDRHTPLFCLADYFRNMSHYGHFLKQFHHDSGKDWPVVLIDLPGRGRSPNRSNLAHYTTPNDANDIAVVASALGIERAIFLGQGHGGQVIMALACQHSHLICGSILIDAAPVLHAPGLVRLRDNLSMILEMHAEKQFQSVTRQVFGKAYPGSTQSELDEIIACSFTWSKKRRARPLFDIALLKRLEHVQFDDIFEPQWPLFKMLGHAPMMLMRTQLADQLERSTFEHMAKLRSDAVQLVIPGQGSPALLAGIDEVGAIIDFAHHINRLTQCTPIVAG